MKDRQIVALERQVRHVNRELRQLRSTVVWGVAGICLVICLVPFLPEVMGVGVLLLAGVFLGICGSIMVKLLEPLYYKWLRRRYRRKDAFLRAEQARMRHEGMSLKSVVQ